VALTFGVYFSFFPGVILQNELSFFNNFSWFVIFIVTYASVCDTIGRWIAGKFDFIPKPWFLVACLIRVVVFLITYLLTFEKVGESFFNSDVFVLVNLGLFAISCGYLSTIGMKFGSDETTKDQGLAGTIMGFHLTLGICLGSTAAIIWFS